MRRKRMVSGESVTPVVRPIGPEERERLRRDLEAARQEGFIVLADVPGRPGIMRAVLIETAAGALLAAGMIAAVVVVLAIGRALGW